MARTKASVGAKVASGKSSKARCSVAAPAHAAATSGTDRTKTSGGGNPVCPRDTPKWQRPITTFFNHHQEKRGDEDDDKGAASSSKSKPKRNIIESDEEASPVKKTTESSSPEKKTAESSYPEKKTEESSPEKPTGKSSSKSKNTALDESIELEELTGENSHKIDEYYPKDKPKGKENRNKEKERHGKRDRDDGIEEGNTKKKIKIN